MEYMCHVQCAYRTSSGHCGRTGGYAACQYRQLHSSVDQPIVRCSECYLHGRCRFEKYLLLYDKDPFCNAGDRRKEEYIDAVPEL